MKQKLSSGNRQMDKAGSIIYYMLRFLARFLTYLGCHLTIRGYEQVPTTGPLLIVCNHLSWLDPILIASFLPRRTWFFAKQEIFFWPIVKWLVRWTGQIPVHRGKSDREALNLAIAYVREQRALLIFPEGTVARQEQMLAAHTGAAMIALRTGTALLPVALVGSRRMLRPGGGWRPHVSIQFGEPYVPSLPTGLSRKENLHSITQDIMLRIARMLPSEQQGIYRNMQKEAEETM